MTTQKDGFPSGMNVYWVPDGLSLDGYPMFPTFTDQCEFAAWRPGRDEMIQAEFEAALERAATFEQECD